ncbi:site-specific integrase [Phytoactinopolyspora mesophila]|uniref:Tyrosine-type recombinase/integrase n=1 Tax=Phytoactinopolyspora mesophila TaxID=2650750 RepID=A0A7K3MCC8_9ACTN|nr:site-specific integrase [Phytoactinopolyspora mesophila]NDL60979.1 tyrosine-type recombinase/integrase [Phytoactinopolyspora mesophila]
MSGRARANGEGSIFPYRNGFAAYAWVVRPDGRRMRKYVYGKTREIVHEKWIKLQQDAKQGPMTSTDMTVADYMTYWLEEVIKPNKAPLTYATYETFIRLYIVPGLGAEKLSRLQVQPRKVQKWLNAVAATCQCCAQGKDAARHPERRRCCALERPECCENLLSPRSLSDIRTCFRSALSNAIDDELITKNVAKSIKLPTVRKPKRKRWTSEQARQFLESARSDCDPFYAAYVLVLVMAMRKGEVLGLLVDAVDLDAGELGIEHQLQRVRRQLLHRETKTEASDDTLPLPGIASTALSQRLARRDRDREQAGEAWQEFGLMFCTRYGTPIEPRNFNRAWDARCRKAEVPKISVHDGRRTCGSLLADLDVHPRVAMRILRHAQFAVTMEIYTEVSSEATQAGLKRLGESLER